MTTLLWCSLAALVGAVIVLGVIARGAINEMRHAFHYRDLQVSRVNDAEREKQAAINETLEVRRALADEQRLHRLLLASRERKKKRGEMPGGFEVVVDPLTPAGELHVKQDGRLLGRIVNIQADDAPTPTTGAS